MQQIKVKELPEGYFVTDTYYPSGNAEFLQPNKKEVKGIGTQIIGPRFFGTKHIQLIGANGKAKTWILQDGEEWYMYLYSNKTKISKETYEEIKTFEEQGKDFFIYKVSEVK